MISREASGQTVAHSERGKRSSGGVKSVPTLKTLPHNLKYRVTKAYRRRLNLRAAQGAAPQEV